MLDNRYKTFFNDNIKQPSFFMMCLNESLFNYCNAYISKSSETREQYLKKALSAAFDARDNIHVTAHDEFKNWYSKENKFDLDDYIDRIDKTLKACL